MSSSTLTIICLLRARSMGELTILSAATRTCLMSKNIKASVWSIRLPFLPCYRTRTRGDSLECQFARVHIIKVQSDSLLASLHHLFTEIEIVMNFTDLY